jgi:hypothetical protein
MRAQLERSEDVMQTYARQNGLVFTEEKIDPPLDSKLFQFQMPAGVVLEETEQ